MSHRFRQVPSVWYKLPMGRVITFDSADGFKTHLHHPDGKDSYYF